jgi:hypothetical protein
MQIGSPRALRGGMMMMAIRSARRFVSPSARQTLIGVRIRDGSPPTAHETRCRPDFGIDFRQRSPLASERRQLGGCPDWPFSRSHFRISDSNSDPRTRPSIRMQRSPRMPSMDGGDGWLAGLSRPRSRHGDMPAALICIRPGRRRCRRRLSISWLAAGWELTHNVQRTRPAPNRRPFETLVAARRVR